MVIKQRQDHPINFEDHAAAFDAALKEGAGVAGWTTIQRDGRNITIGVGKHGGLMKKNHPSHVKEAQKIQNQLLDYLNAEGIKPKHYILEAVRVSQDASIMEYFNTPSIEQLLTYFEGRLAGDSNVLDRRGMLLCRKFEKKHPNTTLKNCRKRMMNYSRI